jgi:hypothetical protein
MCPQGRGGSSPFFGTSFQRRSTVGELEMTGSDTRFDWSKLNSLQLGKYAEYLTKMEFVGLGCDVFSSEVDDHGIDFVVRTRQGSHFDVQVKSFRAKAGQTPYIYLPKDKFVINPSLLLAVVQFLQAEPPKLFLLQSCVNSSPHPLFESRGLRRRKNKPARVGPHAIKKEAHPPE